jgi:hypothetical protein
MAKAHIIMQPKIINIQPLKGLLELFLKENRIIGSFSFESFNAWKPSFIMTRAASAQNEIMNKSL